jgi:hypothetical protein
MVTEEVFGPTTCFPLRALKKGLNFLSTRVSDVVLYSMYRLHIIIRMMIDAAVATIQKGIVAFFSIFSWLSQMQLVVAVLAPVHKGLAAFFSIFSLLSQMRLVVAVSAPVQKGLALLEALIRSVVLFSILVAVSAPVQKGLALLEALIRCVVLFSIYGTLITMRLVDRILVYIMGHWSTTIVLNSWTLLVLGSYMFMLPTGMLQTQWFT